MTEGEPGDAAAAGEPSFDEGRRSGGRAFSGLPVQVALEELEALDRPAPEAPLRRWSDGEPDDVPTPPRLDFKDVGPARHALLIDDPAFDEPARPLGGPKFAGRPPEPVPQPRRRATVGTRRRRKGRAGRFVVWTLVLLGLGVGAVVAYPRVQQLIEEQSVPASLRGYVKGKGVAHAPRAQGYSVRLPKEPQRPATVTSTAGGTATMSIHRSIVANRDYYIVIRVVDVPTGSSIPFGVVGALADPLVGGGAPLNLHRVPFRGQSAYDYQLSTTPTTRARAILRGQRLYVINVQSKSVDTVFDELVDSFRLTG